MTRSDYRESNLLTLGRAVKAIREQRNMSAEELASATGIPGERIAALEAGQLDPTYEVLLGIADGLDTQPSELVSLAERIHASTER